MLCFVYSFLFFFFKQKTAYEMRISDWSSDVCSSDLLAFNDVEEAVAETFGEILEREATPNRIRHAERDAHGVDDRLWQLLVKAGGLDVSLPREIGRASCRERVCQYV